jgi:hypothetical protein
VTAAVVAEDVEEVALEADTALFLWLEPVSSQPPKTFFSNEAARELTVLLCTLADLPMLDRGQSERIARHVRR